MHIHGENIVEAILAPNRYRKLIDNVSYVGEVQEQIILKMKEEFPDKEPIGIGLCTCWEPILMWKLKE